MNSNHHTPSPGSQNVRGQAPRDLRGADRRGSILIFVVGILVLLALAATAYLSTARNDRVTAKQNEYNVQIDLLLEGVRQAVLAKIMSDPSVPTDLASIAPLNTVFADAPTTDTDPWIASSIPILATPGSPFSGTNPPVWRFLTSGIFTGGFEDPITGIKYPNRSKAQPTVLNGRPALIFADDTTATDTTSVTTSALTASDADNDGVADTGLIRVPVGLLSGVAYYAGIRVVDNNSKVNVNTAFSRDVDFYNDSTPTGAALGNTGIFAAPTGMLTSSIGLREFLHTFDPATPANNTEFNLANSYRLGAATMLNNVVTGTADTTDVYRSLGDKLFHDLGRRTAVPATGATAFNLSDQLALAYRFALRDPTASSTQTETTFTQSIVTGVPTSPYPVTAAGITSWFTNLFDFGSELAGTPSAWKPRRALLTTSNPQGMLVRGADMDGLILAILGANIAPGSAGVPPATGSYRSVVRFKTDEPTPVSPAILTGEQMRYYSPFSANNAAYKAAVYEDLPHRCSINTAGFPELWRAFWNAMCDGTGTPSNFHLGNPQIGNKSVFNPAWTDRLNWNDTNELLLRSALAAVNVESLRSGGRADATGTQNDVICRSFKMPVAPAAGPTTSYTINTFGFRRQPFITQAVLVTDGSSAPAFYAIELFNPYDVPISMTNWHLISLVPAVGPLVGYTPTDLAGPTTGIPAGTTIAAHGFLIIASAGAPTGGITFTASVPVLTAPGLLTAGANDVMLVRPRRGDGQLSGEVFTTGTVGDDPSTPDTLEPNEGVTATPLLANFVPIDRVAMPLTPVPSMLYLHQRPNDAALPWKFAFENVGNSWQAPVAPATVVPLGAFNAVYTGDATVLAGVPLPPTPSWPNIQLDNVNWPVNTLEPPLAAGTIVRFPYGGFSRLGELLQTPFMGSWTINTDANIGIGTTFIDSIPEPYDAFNCYHSATMTGADDIGRFFKVNTVTGAVEPWAAGIFEFFTCINHPWDDYDIDGPNVIPDDVPSATVLSPTWPIAPLYGTNYGLNHQKLDVGQGAAVQGLININTAPQKVLATLPWMPAGGNLLTWDAVTGIMTVGPETPARDDNEKIALAIVAYRDYVNGGKHFEHISDLLAIPAFTIAQTAITTAAEPDDAQGDFTPLNPHTVTDPITLAITPQDTDLVRNDFEEKSLLLTRVSNLITTRSDTFTVYIDLQGWKNPGTPQATLVTERRAAMIVDRSALTPSNPAVVATPVPAN